MPTHEAKTFCVSQEAGVLSSLVRNTGDQKRVVLLDPCLVLACGLLHCEKKAKCVHSLTQKLELVFISSNEHF